MRARKAVDPLAMDFSRDASTYQIHPRRPSKTRIWQTQDDFFEDNPDSGPSDYRRYLIEKSKGRSSK